MLVLAFDPSAVGFQFVQEVDWIGFFGIQYKLGVDGISLALVVLTTTLTRDQHPGQLRADHRRA